MTRMLNMLEKEHLSWEKKKKKVWNCTVIGQRWDRDDKNELGK